MKILEAWLKDMPQQFSGKKNIGVLVGAFARQMQELVQVFDDLDTKLDIDKACGQNLDYVGTIVSLSRKEAGILAGIGVEEPVISDERYRQFLKYKLLRNTNDCTYYDIMQSIEILWKADNIRYFEDPQRPATILIRLQTMSIDAEIDPLVGKVTAIKPAGVALIYTINYTAIFDARQMERFYVKNMHLHNVIPFWTARFFDGSELMDGSRLMDAARDYGMRVGIIHGAGGVVSEEQAAVSSVAVRAPVYMKEDVRVGGQGVSFAVSFWQVLFFDGSAQMDGSHLMDDSRQEIRAGATVGTVAQVHEEFGNAAVRVQRDVAYFDGSLLMDGSHLMDSIDREEEI